MYSIFGVSSGLSLDMLAAGTLALRQPLLAVEMKKYKASICGISKEIYSKLSLLIKNYYILI